MKKTLIVAAIASILFTQCEKKQDKFAIGSGSIGQVTSETVIKQIDSIFANDSIVPQSSIKDALGTQGEVDVYEKSGAKLLRLSPDDENNPDAVITNVRVYDARYKTDKGLHLNSTFKDIKDNYKISGIQTSFDAVIISLEGSDVYVTIDKKELPGNLRYNLNVTIEATQIPDTAKFKYFMIAWDGANE